MIINNILNIYKIMEKEKIKKFLYAGSEVMGKASKKCAGLTLITFFLGFLGFLTLDLIERNEFKNKLKNNQNTVKK